MKSVKKIVISFVISLVVVFIIQGLVNKFNKNEQIVYLITRDIYKGEKILKEDVKKIRINKNVDTSKYTNIEIEGKFANVNIKAGKLLEKGDLLSNKIEDEETYEYITVEVKSGSDALAYQLKKGDNINIYYTTKNKKLDSLVINKDETIYTDSNTTFKVFDNIEVIGLYNINGEEVKKGEQYKMIMIRVKSQEALLVSNIKDEGVFYVSTIR